MDKLFALFLKEKEYLQNCTPNTIKFLKCSYNAFRRSGATEITKSSLIEFVVNIRQRGLSAKSCNDYIAGMNTFLKWLHENEYASELFKIPRMKEEKKILPSFSDQELQRIISYKPKGFGQIRAHAVLLTLIDTGCRINELLTLKKDNVDFDNLLMKVMGKGRKERIIPISLELRKVLFKYLQKHEYDFVFPAREGTLLNHQNLARDAKILFKNLGIPFLGFHTFRRTFARQYLKHGGNLVYLQKTLGHSRLETTRIYLDVETEDLQRTHLKTSILSRLKRT